MNLSISAIHSSTPVEEQSYVHKKGMDQIWEEIRKEINNWRFRVRRPDKKATLKVCSLNVPAFLKTMAVIGCTVGRAAGLVVGLVLKGRSYKKMAEQGAALGRKIGFSLVHFLRRQKPLRFARLPLYRATNIDNGGVVSLSNKINFTKIVLRTMRKTLIIALLFAPSRAAFRFFPYRLRTGVFMKKKAIEAHLAAQWQAVEAFGQSMAWMKQN